MKIEFFNKSFKFIKKLYITFLLILKFNTVFTLFLNKAKELNYALKTVYISKKRDRKWKKDVMCLILLYITKNDPNTEVNLYLIRY